MPAATANRNLSEFRKDMDRFIKNFVSRSAHIIILSRTEDGDLCKRSCKRFSSNQDWFQLNISENDDVHERLQKTWNEFHSRTVPVGSAVCLEMSLVTSSNERMILEIWEFALSSDPDPSGKQTYELYCRLGILLKSLITVSRVVPSFRLAYGQREDTYQLHYKIRTGPRQDEEFGENSKLIPVGSIGMLHGTFSVSVRYRTKLVLSSREKAKDEMVWQSNHFSKTDPGMVHLWEKSPEFTSQNEINQRNQKLKKPLNECSPYGAFADDDDSHGKVRDVPSDLCDMFCTLLLDEDEMMPSQVKEREYEESDEEKDGDLYEDAFNRPQDNFNNRDQFVLIDLKPAFADCSTDLGIFFSGAPPVLKSLQTDGCAGDVHEEEELQQDTLQRQMEQMKSQFNTFDKDFFADVLNEA